MTADLEPILLRTAKKTSWNAQTLQALTLGVWRTEMLAIIAGVLIVCWLLGFFAFHVSGFLIHILLIVGVIMIILHFMRGRTSA